MQRRSCKSVGHRTTQHEGDGKANGLFQKVRLADAVDFSSFCRLCARSHDPEKMTPLFKDPVSSISYKISEVFRVQLVKNGDGLPAFICNSCFANLNFVHKFIKKSLAADRLLRKAIILACATFDTCPPALNEVEVECSDEPIDFKLEPLANEQIGFKNDRIAFDGEPIALEDEAIEIKDEPYVSEAEPIGFEGPDAEDDSGDHSYSQSPERPVYHAEPHVLRVVRGNRLTVLKLGEPNETKHGHINFLNNSTGRTTRMPLECRVLSQSELDSVHSHLESEQAASAAGPKDRACEPIVRNLIKSKLILSNPVMPNPIMGNTTTPQANGPAKSVLCDICGRRFRCRAQLRDHMYSHTGERPYACTMCGKGYTLRTHLNTHMRVHSGERLMRFQCEICGQHAPSLSGLNKHMPVHTNLRPFACPICGKGFKHKPHVKAHILTHSKDKPHGCAVCGKRFKGVKQCAVHEAAHVSKPQPPERTFQCHLCGKAFGYKRLLETHVAGHEGRVRDFECPQCAKRFVDRDAVKRHVMLVHLAERPFPCAVCGRAFKVAYYVRKHMLKMHGIDSSAPTLINPEEMIPGYKALD